MIVDDSTKITYSLTIVDDRCIDVDDRDSEARMVAEAVVHDELPDDPRAPGYQQRLGSHLPPP